jgi:enterochelin esterase family protein
VIFQLYGPKISTARVEIAGDKVEMTRDDKGVWSATVGPLAPDIYGYHFVIDDSLVVPDPHNDFVKGPTESLVEVPGETPTLWEQRDVPHGVVHVHLYPSRSLGVTRRMHVYTPPGYDVRSSARYPVLYLLHGSGDDDSGWDVIGRANLIFDNLIAVGQCKPMIVVMPEGHVPSGANRQTGFESDLLQDVIPTVEASYRVQADPMHRAIAGLSMGGFQTMQVGMKHPERFGWIGVMSAGPRNGANLDQEYAALAANPKQAEREFRLLYISAGDTDVLRDAAKQLDAWLTAHQIRHEYHEFPGGHEWKVWRGSLIQLAPMLFTSPPSK